MRSCKEFFTKEPALIFVLAVTFAVTVLWLFFLLAYASPVPTADDWLLAAESHGLQDFNWRWMWALHGEHRYPIIKFLMVCSAHFGIWCFPRCLSVLACAATALFIVFRVRDMRAKAVWADAVFPLVFLHAGHATNFFWTLQLSFILALCLACIAAALLIEDPRKSSPLHAWIIFAALVALPLNSGAGLLFTPLLGGAFFVRGIYAWRKWGQSPVLPAAASGIAAFFCVLYVSGMSVRPQMLPEFVSLWSELENILTCAALGLGMAGWRAGLPLGILVLAFNLVTLGLLAHLWRRSLISGIVLFSALMALGACWTLPAFLGVARMADTRYITVTSGIIAVPLFLWAVMERHGVYLKKTGILLQASLVLFLLATNSFSAAIHFEKQKSRGGKNLLKQIEEGFPLEIISSRFASQMISWNSPKYSEEILKRLMGTPFLNMSKLKAWPEVYPMDYALLPHSKVMLSHMQRSRSRANAFIGCRPDSTLKIRLPRKEYVRALYLEFDITGIPQMCNSRFCVSWVDSDGKACEQSCLMNGYSNVDGLQEHIWVWVNSEIGEFSVQPRKNSTGERFLLELKSIRLYQK